MTSYQLVDSSSNLKAVATELASAPVLYLDTEFESNRHETRLCLIQVSTGGIVYLIDTLRLEALEPLQGALARPSCEWVLHAGLQDVALLTEALRLGAPPRIFDTQVAWAATTAEYSVSLAYLQFKVLGVRSVKGHQADDWKRRPLPLSQLEYAASDVEYLPKIYAHLKSRALELGREALLYQASQELLFPRAEPPANLSLESFRNAWQLDRHSQAGLRYLIRWFNALGSKGRQAAPDAKVLLSIARRMPSSGEELGRIKGVPRRFAASQGEALAGQLMRASEEADTNDFVPIDPPPYATFESIRRDAWLQGLRAKVCSELSMAPELAFPQSVLKRMRASIVEGRVLTESLSGWRKDLLEPALLRTIEEDPPPKEI